VMMVLASLVTDAFASMVFRPELVHEGRAVYRPCSLHRQNLDISKGHTSIINITLRP
jgi:hypothetical protein